jgi:hypothetical protein
MGRYVEARRRRQAARVSEVPRKARRAHLLADLHIDSQCYRKARRHLRSRWLAA